MRSNIFRQLSISLLLFGMLGNSVVFAQKAAPAKAASSQKCASGAWTGSVTYSRSQTSTNNKTVDRVSGRGQDTTSFEMTYDYKAQVAVSESPEKNGSSKAVANIAHRMKSTEKVIAHEENSCDRGKTWKDMSAESLSVTQTVAEGRENANVNVGVNSDGSYTVSVGVPQINGRVTGSQSTTFSGQCTPKEGKNFNMPSTETTVDGNSLTSDGRDRVNPDDPNTLSGSYSKTWQNVTETITWSLRKCGAPLRLTELKFEHPKYPDFKDWKEIIEQTGTIDGNMVRIKAKVLNLSGETKSAKVKISGTFKGDKWDGARPDEKLEGDNEQDVSLDPGEEKEIEMMWDSSGYAWYDDGRPRLVQRVKAELVENEKKVDELTKNLKVAPKPLVLVHGLWSNWKAWETWQNILTTSHSYDWKAFPVGENGGRGGINLGGEFLSSTPSGNFEQNATGLEMYIHYAQLDRNAWHVDLVAHSMGGLVSRYYIQKRMPSMEEDGRPRVSHLVMLGTPNEGSKCADLMSAGFGLFDKNVEALSDLRTDKMKTFNNQIKNRKGVKFSVLAGDPIPTICYATDPNDGVVTVPSAFHDFTDTKTSKSLHTDLTGTKDFSSFVKPHVAIGPKGDHGPDRSQYAAQVGDELYRGVSPFTNVSLAAAADMKPEIFFGKGTTIKSKQTVEIEIPIPANTEGFGLTFMASPLVSATLVDANGAVLGQNLKGAGGMFRTIIVDKNLSGTTVKLRLLSDEKLEATAIVSAWKKPNRP